MTETCVAKTSEEEKKNCCVDGPIIALLITLVQFGIERTTHHYVAEERNLVTYRSRNSHTGSVTYFLFLQ
jgi:hypothetical protein